MTTAPVSRKNSKGIILLGFFILAFFGLSYIGRQWLGSPDQEPPEFTSISERRIVALSPSSVEIVYQLGLEDQLVGVSRFSNFPPEAKDQEVVGGYLDLDFEKVVRLQPDTVILLREQKALAGRLEQLGIQTLMIDHASTTGITDSITGIGREFGKEKLAATITGDIRERLDRIKAALPPSTQKPRVLISIDRDTSAPHPDHLIAAGREGVHQEYLGMVGALNAYTGPAAYPSLSREKLIHLDPDIIIDLIPPDTFHQIGEKKLLAQWEAYPELRPVRNGHIIFLHEHRHMIPGPRFVDTVEAIYRAIKSLPAP